ncbi:hypothetical protein SME46J_12830 [Serratia marcescens]|nr:hypothetical protein SME46J_12830 [Serratia marcescens]
MDKNEPYFFNPGMSPEQLEHWLGQQKLHLSHYNRVVKEKAALLARLEEIEGEMELLTKNGIEGIQSFPSGPNPLLENRQ